MTSLPLKLVALGLGHCPAMKNSKMLARGRLITDPKKQKWMDQCIRSFESQLRSAFPTSAKGTWTEQQRLYWTALFERCPEFDDNWMVIPEITIKAVQVGKGKEGAVVEISVIP